MDWGNETMKKLQGWLKVYQYYRLLLRQEKELETVELLHFNFPGEQAESHLRWSRCS